MQKLPFFAALAFCCASTAQVTAPPARDAFPGKTWVKAIPEDAGWSAEKLKEAYKFFNTLPPGNLVVVDRGRVIVEWGDPAMKIKISSMRKSILSALYGIDQASGKLDLDTPIERLGIDDDPPLTPEEKKATVRMLLEARSGIYHSYVAGTPSMRENMPARGSHVPGTFWYYNNWDFNALGTIFEQQFQTKIGAEFRDKIAQPIQMQDFQLQDMYYQRVGPEALDYEKSAHPAYHFRLSARDLARFGYLVLQDGNWSGTRVIPAGWIEQSTHAYTENARDGAGYGYLWWVNGFGLGVKNYYAHGALGKFLVIIPDRGLVVAFLNHTEFPDNASAIPAAELKKLPDVPVSNMGKLLELLLAAQSANPGK